MIIIKRQMSPNTERTNTGNDNIDTYLPYSQASINSDGNITLRNYDKSNANKDEIYILSKEETKALVDLFKEIGRLYKESPLPY